MNSIVEGQETERVEAISNVDSDDVTARSPIATIRGTTARRACSKTTTIDVYLGVVLANLLR